MRPPPWFRLLRAGVFASVCVALSLTGHDLMAARPAPVFAGWIAFAALIGAGYRLAGRRWAFWQLLLAVESVQGCLHLWFSQVTPADPAWASGPVNMPMSGPHPAGIPEWIAPGDIPGPRMLMAHAVAGLLVALWLAAGERAAWRALHALTGALLAPVLRVFACGAGREPGPRPPRRAYGRSRDEAAPAIVALRFALRRRGPPVRTGVLARVPA